MARGVNQAGEERARNFYHVGWWKRHGKTLGATPQGLMHQSNGVGEGWQGFGVPGGSPQGNRLPGAQDMGGPGDPGEQAQEDRRSASNGQVGAASWKVTSNCQRRTNQ